MSIINTDGMTFIGPGSEWFWTAFQGLVVAVSLWAVFRQLRLQNIHKARDDVARLTETYHSERMLRYQLAVWEAVRDDTPPSDVPAAAYYSLTMFWEEVAGFTKRKHLDAPLMAYHMGSNACYAWTATEPWIQYQRGRQGEDFASDFEWFVKRVVRLDPTLAAELGNPKRVYAGGVGTLQGLIDTEVELRH